MGDSYEKNILVVDDSALMRRVMCDIINSDSKFQATDYCRDGLEAYEKLKHTSYDGVVLDVNMPRMDGLQLLEKLQKERHTCKCGYGKYTYRQQGSRCYHFSHGARSN